MSFSVHDLWDLVGTESKPVLTACPHNDCHHQVIVGGKLADRNAAMGREFVCYSCFKVCLMTSKDMAKHNKLQRELLNDSILTHRGQR